MSNFIYLASQSPRRQQLLEQIGVANKLLIANTDGDVAENVEALEAVQPQEVPITYVQRVTAAKLRAAVARWQRRGLPLAPILCADTTVALAGQILGKPDNAAHAANMLQQLSGKKHQVFTSVAVYANGLETMALSTSEVSVAALTTVQIDAYIASGEPFGKAGAYGIQGAAAAWIQEIKGSYSGIMGLPLFETAQLLNKAGLPILAL
jgi:septum formation protein